VHRRPLLFACIGCAEPADMQSHGRCSGCGQPLRDCGGAWLAKTRSHLAWPGVGAGRLDFRECLVLANKLDSPGNGTTESCVEFCKDDIASPADGHLGFRACHCRIQQVRQARKQGSNGRWKIRVLAPSKKMLEAKQGQDGPRYPPLPSPTLVLRSLIPCL